MRDWAWNEVSPKFCSKLFHSVAKGSGVGTGFGASAEHMQTEAERIRPNPRQVDEGWGHGLHEGIAAQPFAVVKWCGASGQLGIL